MKYRCKSCAKFTEVIADGEVEYAVCSKCGHGGLIEVDSTDKHGYIMYMACCERSQVWRDGAGKPVVGEIAWCVHCQKQSKIIKTV